MTEASNAHSLSKLDLFTPNKLHPALPPLTLGTYMCMGNDTLMLFTPSVLTRKAHIHGLLGDKANDAGFLRRRVAAHERLLQHMDVMHVVYKRGTVRWVRAHRYVGTGVDEDKGKRRVKSLSSAESRDACVRKALAKQWEAMGMGEVGASSEEAIEIE